jgi:ribosomal protein S18 acetylase RimI-like enzyme
LRVVPATPADLNRYVDLLEELADWLHSRGIEQWPRGRARGGMDYYSASIANGEAYMAFDGDEFIAGFRLLKRDLIVWPDIDADDALYVYNLAVRRAWAGRGIGRQLLTWAERQAAAAGRRYLRLDCVPTNVFLRQYYEDAGFTARGEIDAVYPVIGVMPLCRYEKTVETTWP